MLKARYRTRRFKILADAYSYRGGITSWLAPPTKGGSDFNVDITCWVKSDTPVTVDTWMIIKEQGTGKQITQKMLRVPANGQSLKFVGLRGTMPYGIPYDLQLEFWLLNPPGRPAGWHSLVEKSFTIKQAVEIIPSETTYSYSGRISNYEYTRGAEVGDPIQVTCSGNWVKSDPAGVSVNVYWTLKDQAGQQLDFKTMNVVANGQGLPMQTLNTIMPYSGGDYRLRLDFWVLSPPGKPAGWHRLDYKEFTVSLTTESIQPDPDTPIPTPDAIEPELDIEPEEPSGLCSLPILRRSFICRMLREKRVKKQIKLKAR